MNKYNNSFVSALFIAGVLVFAPTANAKANSVEAMVRAEAVRQGVPVSLALSVAKHESGFRCGAVGRHGERGVMQIKPSTARSIGYRGSAAGLNNCSTGIRYGMIYLRMAYKLSGGNTYRAAVMYNGGLGTKRKRSAYAETVTRKHNYGRYTKPNKKWRGRSLNDLVHQKR